MDLTLSEQLLLVELDDETGRGATGAAPDAGLAAAVLLDLAAAGLVAVGEDGKLEARAAPAPEHPVLAEADAIVRDEDARRDAKGWIDHLPRDLRPLRERVARPLVERGVLNERHRRILGIVPATDFPAADPAPEQELRERLREVLVEARDPTDDEALLLGLLEPLGLVDGLVAREERHMARIRAKAVAEHGLAGRAVLDVVREMQAAVMAAVFVTTISPSS